MLQTDKRIEMELKEMRTVRLGKLTPFNEQEQKIFQQFSEKEQHLLKNHLKEGIFGDDVIKYIGSALEVPIAQFHKKFMQTNKKNSDNLPQDEVIRLEKYIRDFQKDKPLMKSPKEQLLLFSNFMGLEGSKTERIEKMKKIDVLQQNQLPCAPLNDIYDVSISAAIRQKYHDHYKQTENKLIPCHNPVTGQIYPQESVNAHQQQSQSDDKRYLPLHDIDKLGMTIKPGAKSVVTTYKKETEAGQIVQHCEMLFNGKDIQGLPPPKTISEKLTIVAMKVKETAKNIGKQTTKNNAKENDTSGFEM